MKNEKKIYLFTCQIYIYCTYITATVRLASFGVDVRTGVFGIVSSGSGLGKTVPGTVALVVISVVVIIFCEDVVVVVVIFLATFEVGSGGEGRAERAVRKRLVEEDEDDEDEDEDENDDDDDDDDDGDDIVVVALVVGRC